MKRGTYTYGDIQLINFAPFDVVVNIGNFTCIAQEVKAIFNYNHSHFKDAISSYPWGYINQNTFNNAVNRDSTNQSHMDFLEIGNDVWIGAGSVLKGGIKIGDGAVIASYSYVTKDIPPYAIVGGNPATILKYRFEKDLVKELLALEWWNFSTEKINSAMPLFQKPLTSESLLEIKKILTD